MTWATRSSSYVRGQPLRNSSRVYFQGKSALRCFKIEISDFVTKRRSERGFWHDQGLDSEKKECSRPQDAAECWHQPTTSGVLPFQSPVCPSISRISPRRPPRRFGPSQHSSRNGERIRIPRRSPISRSGSRPSRSAARRSAITRGTRGAARLAGTVRFSTGTSRRQEPSTRCRSGFPAGCIAYLREVRRSRRSTKPWAWII